MSTSTKPVTVIVKIVGGGQSGHPEARGYHIDPDQNLHIIGEKGNIASYARGHWSSVAWSSITIKTATNA